MTSPILRDSSLRLREKEAPPAREMIASEFSPSQFEHQKEQILLQTIPFAQETPADHPLCQLPERSAKNYQKILRQIEKLAVLLGNSLDFVSGCWEATTAARNAELVRSGFEARYECLQALEGNMTSGVQNFIHMAESS
jgi:hypothetical protein